MLNSMDSRKRNRALVILAICLVYFISIFFVDIKSVIGFGIVLMVFAKAMELGEIKSPRTKEQRFNLYLDMARKYYNEHEYEKSLSYYRRAKVYYDLSKEDLRIEEVCREHCT